MIKKALLCILVVVFVGSCVSRPDDILSSTEMRMILVDLHKAEAIASVSNYTYRDEEKEISCYQYVLEKHGVTQAEFDSAVVWYTGYPSMFERVYERVQAEIQKENNDLEAMIRAIEAANEKSNREPLKLDFLDSTIVSYYALYSPEPYRRFAGAILDSCILELPENDIEKYIYPIGFVDSLQVINDSISLVNDSLKLKRDSIPSKMTFKPKRKIKKVK